MKQKVVSQQQSTVKIQFNEYIYKEKATKMLPGIPNKIKIEGTFITNCYIAKKIYIEMDVSAKI